MSVQSDEALFFVVDDPDSGERLDKVLAKLLPSVSRARLQTWIEQGAVTVNGATAAKIRQKVAAGDWDYITAKCEEALTYIAEARK